MIETLGFLEKGKRSLGEIEASLSVTGQSPLLPDGETHP